MGKIGDMSVSNAYGSNSASVYYYKQDQLNNRTYFVIKNFSADWDGTDQEEDYQPNSGNFVMHYRGWRREVGSYNAENISFSSISPMYESIEHQYDGNIGDSDVTWRAQEISGGGGDTASLTLTLSVPQIPKNIRRIVGYGGDVNGNIENHYTYYDNRATLDIYGNADSRVGFIFDHWESSYDYNGSEDEVIYPKAYVPQTQDYYTCYRIRTFDFYTKVSCWYGTSFYYEHHIDGFSTYEYIYGGKTYTVVSGGIVDGNTEPSHNYSSEVVGSTAIEGGPTYMKGVPYLKSFTYNDVTEKRINAIDSRNYHFSHWTEYHNWQENSSSSWGPFEYPHTHNFPNPIYRETDTYKNPVVHPREEGGCEADWKCHPNTRQLIFTAVFAPNWYEIGIKWDTDHIEKVVYYTLDKLGSGDYTFYPHDITNGSTVKLRYKDCFQLKAIPKENCIFTHWSDGNLNEFREYEVVLDQNVKWYEAFGADEYIGPGDYKGVKIVTVRSCRVHDYVDFIEDNTSEKGYIYIEIEIDDDENYPVQLVTCEDENGKSVDVIRLKDVDGKKHYAVMTTLDPHLSSYYYFTIWDTVKTYRHICYIRSGLYTLVEYQNILKNDVIGVGLGVLPSENCLTLSGDIDFVVPNSDYKLAKKRNCFDFVNGQLKKESIPFDSGILRNAKVVDDNKYKWVCDIYSIEGSKFLKCCALLETTVTIEERYNELVLLDFSNYGISFNSRMPVDVTMFDDVKTGIEQVGVKPCAIAENNQIKTTEPMDEGTLLYVNLWLPLLTDRYELTTECGDFITKINKSPDKTDYTTNTNVILTATVKDGYEFDCWKKMVNGEYTVVYIPDPNDPEKEIEATSPTLAIRIEEPTDWDGESYKTDNKYKAFGKEK